MYYEDVLKSTDNIDRVNKVVVSLSGGLDSGLLTHLMVAEFGKENIHCISFNYNQRHSIELQLAKKITKSLGVTHSIVDISFLGDMVKDVSAMVKGDVKTPTMKEVLGNPAPSTYVPNRNMILLSIVAAYAESVKANGIALGIQATDSYNYHDTTPEFYDAIQNVLNLNRKNQISFIAPFLNLSKEDEIRIGRELNVDFSNFWSCYNPIKTDASCSYEREAMGGWNQEWTHLYKPCGVCPSCCERANAFEKAGVVDPVVENGVWGK